MNHYAFLAMSSEGRVRPYDPVRASAVERAYKHCAAMQLASAAKKHAIAEPAQ
jgi:hypothetical protein